MKKQKVAFAAVMALLVLTACEGENSNPDGGDNQGDSLSGSTTDGTSSTDISYALFSNRSANCADYVALYTSSVVDTQTQSGYTGSVQITVSGNECLISSNAIPNHDFNESGHFATPVSAQSQNYKVPANPEFAATVTALKMGDDAVFLNGVKLDLLPAACYGVGSEPLGREKIGCHDDQIDNPWRYDPMSLLNQFGTDTHNAHTQPSGAYHYHGNPMAMFDQQCESSAVASPLLGFAADGYPVYGPCFDDNGTVRKATSGYTLKVGVRQAVSGYSTPQQGNGAIASANYDGQFRGDYEFSDAGDLDACNGMSVDGQYGYYVTDSFPWVINCYKGTPDSSF